MPRHEGDVILPDEFAAAGGTLVEFEPANWNPLEQRLGAKCGEFMWMYRKDGIEYYKHIRTRRYIMLDSRGICVGRYGSELWVVDFHLELQYVREEVDGE